MGSGSKWAMIGPRPCAYSCAYVNPVFTSQSYDINHKHKKNELVRFSCAYAYPYVDPVFTCVHMCLCLCLCSCVSENQALETLLKNHRLNLQLPFLEVSGVVYSTFYGTVWIYKLHFKSTINNYNDNNNNSTTLQKRGKIILRRDKIGKVCEKEAKK